MMWVPHESVRTTEEFISGCCSSAEQVPRLPYVLTRVRPLAALAGTSVAALPTLSFAGNQ